MQLLLLGLGHVDELEGQRVASSGSNHLADLVGELTRRRVPGGRYGNDHLGTALTGLDRAEQPEVADGVEQTRVDDATDGLLERLVGIGHRPGRCPVITSLVDLGVLLS